MTEAKWLRCNEPVTMLEYLRGRVSERKVRLFACGCCRRVWDRLADERSREAVRAAEGFADGAVTDEQLQGAEDAAWHLVARVPERTPAEYAAVLAWQTAFHIAGADMRHFVRRVLRASAGAESRQTLAALVRDVFGNPFRPVPVAPSWLAWHGGCAVTVARTIYQEGRFGDLPILADALEEAGCRDEALLAHCRDRRGHARGCWVIDALLGKE
jgi:hypothetical protein